MAAHAAQLHAVGAELLHRGLGDVGHHVGRQVGRRVVYLVQQLFLDGVLVDAPAGAGRLGDDAVAIGIDLGDRVTEVRQAGDVLVAGVGVVATRDLRAAFEQVPGHRGTRQPVPVVVRPAEMRKRRANRQRRVGDAAGTISAPASKASAMASAPK